MKTKLLTTNKIVFFFILAMFFLGIVAAVDAGGYTSAKQLTKNTVSSNEASNVQIVSTVTYKKLTPVFREEKVAVGKDSINPNSPPTTTSMMVVSGDQQNGSGQYPSKNTNTGISSNVIQQQEGDPKTQINSGEVQKITSSDYNVSNIVPSYSDTRSDSPSKDGSIVTQETNEQILTTLSKEEIIRGRMKQDNPNSNSVYVSSISTSQNKVEPYTEAQSMFGAKGSEAASTQLTKAEPPLSPQQSNEKLVIPFNAKEQKQEGAAIVPAKSTVKEVIVSFFKRWFG